MWWISQGCVSFPSTPPFDCIGANTLMFDWGGGRGGTVCVTEMRRSQSMDHVGRAIKMIILIDSRWDAGKWNTSLMSKYKWHPPAAEACEMWNEMCIATLTCTLAREEQLISIIILKRMTHRRDWLIWQVLYLRYTSKGRTHTLHIQTVKQLGLKQLPFCFLWRVSPVLSRL